MRIYEGCVRRSKEKKQNEDVLRKLGIAGRVKEIAPTNDVRKLV
jgi:hypothetical protein